MFHTVHDQCFNMFHTVYHNIVSSCSIVSMFQHVLCFTLFNMINVLTCSILLFNMINVSICSVLSTSQYVLCFTLFTIINVSTYSIVSTMNMVYVSHCSMWSMFQHVLLFQHGLCFTLFPMINVSTCSHCPFVFYRFNKKAAYWPCSRPPTTAEVPMRRPAFWPTTSSWECCDWTQLETRLFLAPRVTEYFKGSARCITSIGL